MLNTLAVSYMTAVRMDHLLDPDDRPYDRREPRKHRPVLRFALSRLGSAALAAALFQRPIFGPNRD